MDSRGNGSRNNSFYTDNTFISVERLAVGLFAFQQGGFFYSSLGNEGIASKTLPEFASPCFLWKLCRFALVSGILLSKVGGGCLFTYNSGLECRNEPVNIWEGGGWRLPGVGGQGNCKFYKRFFSMVFRNSRITYRLNWELMGFYYILFNELVFFPSIDFRSLLNCKFSFNFTNWSLSTCLYKNLEFEG